jgi:GDP-D-mannose 3', 5'-epimerase
MNKNDRILVCGAGGFIGGHLVAELVRQGFTDVLAIDIKPRVEWHQWPAGVAKLPHCDLRLAHSPGGHLDSALLNSWVFNLAADMGGMGFIENNKAACMMSVLINTNLLAESKHSNLARYFYASSACVYNADKQRDPNVTALKEEDAYPAMPEDGYGWEKLFSERMCRHFREDYGVPTRIARYHNVYGPHGTFDGGREKAPAAICRKVIEAKLSGNHEIEIWGDGNQTRSFMFIDDCIKGTLAIAQSDIVDPINLGSSELVSINQLVDLVEEIAGIKLKRTYNRSAPKGVNGRNSDNTRIKELLGWEPSIKLRDGLTKTYAWIFNEMTKSK